MNKKNEKGTLSDDNENESNEIEISDNTDNLESSEISETSYNSPKQISKGLKIFDYILANICLLQFIFQLYMKLTNAPNAPTWMWVIMPAFFVIGLISHDKMARIFCIVIWIISIAQIYLNYQMQMQELMLMEMLRR